MTRDEMEARRLQSIALFEKGIAPAKKRNARWGVAAFVAKELGVSRQTSSRWHQDWKLGKSLRKRKPTGRNPRLTPEQKEQVRIAFEQCGTRRAVREFVRERFGVEYNLDHLFKAMRKWGVARIDTRKRLGRAERATAQTEVRG